MQVVFDIEANSLINPDKIHLIVCKDIKTNLYYIFRNITSDEKEKERFLTFSKQVDLWIGHNIIGYDFPILFALLGQFIKDVIAVSCDTLIISKLVDYPRNGHSIEDYGIEFGIPKGDNKATSFFSKWSQELEDYCIRDVDICHKIYLKYLRYINNPDHHNAIVLEHSFQLIVNNLHTDGFAFNREKASKLLEKVSKELEELDKVILKEFPPKLKLIREIHPKVTKHGTLSRTDFRWVTDGDLSVFNGGPFCRCAWTPFNPDSHKQIIEILSQAGWQPTDKTKTHIEAERELTRLKHSREENKEVDIATLSDKLKTLRETGWKINEENLSTLPDSSPSSARSLARRILLESRRRTLTEWLELVGEDGRIHGRFYSIGAWTHRMAHQQPNTANIPNEFDTEGKVKPLGKEMRQLWCAPRNRLLSGDDAEGIQLRIFAHYIDDAEFTEALVKGRKEDESDPHSLNKRILGDVCKTRAAAKRFIYALLLGAGVGKLTEILSCSQEQTEEALGRLLERYTGFAYLKKTIIPADAKRGWFTGLDGRKVRIPGDTAGERRHLCMSGYLQNGEAIVVKKSVLKTLHKIKTEIRFPERVKLVNIVHDEVIFETPNDYTIAEKVNSLFNNSIEEVGVELNLKCPLKGDGHVGHTWYDIH